MDAQPLKGSDMNAKKREELLGLLQARFERNMERHTGMTWDAVQARLAAQPDKLRSLGEMEETGGEPDVVGRDAKTGEYTFYDCSPESPPGRRSLCYDEEALAARKENKPAGSAVGMAASMGITVLTEAQYRELHTLGTFDAKTSSWLAAPPAIRKLGGAIFGDFRFNTVFVYHNGVQSYYAGRGFRGALKV
jgi:hypothetical protein